MSYLQFYVGKKTLHYYGGLRLSDRKREMIHNGKCSHSRYLPDHLAVAEKSCLGEKVNDAHVKPSKAVLGFHPEPEEAAPSIHDSVRKILINKDRTKYELKNAKQRMGISKKLLFCSCIFTYQYHVQYFVCREYLSYVHNTLQ